MSTARRIVTVLFTAITLIPMALVSLFSCLVWASDGGSPDGGREWAVGFVIPFVIVWTILFGNLVLIAAGEGSMFIWSLVGAFALWGLFWLLAAIPGEFGTALGVILIIGLNCAVLCFVLLVLFGYEADDARVAESSRS